MTRRTLLKLMALFPLAGPTVVKALAKANGIPALGNGIYLPAHFPAWNQAVDGLEEAGKWAIEIERTRLPSDIILPGVNQVWETVQDCEVSFRPCFASNQIPFGKEANPCVAGAVVQMLLGGKSRLQRAERVRVIAVDDNDKPLHAVFQPLRYAELHAVIVPEEIREMPGYVGYELSAKTAKTIPDFDKDAHQTYFTEAFRLIEHAQ
jgi:hypothetical protein